MLRVVGVLLIFFPIVGAVGLVAALPLIGCTVLCGAMAFLCEEKRKKINKNSSLKSLLTFVPLM